MWIAKGVCQAALKPAHNEVESTCFLSIGHEGDHEGAPRSGRFTEDISWSRTTLSWLDRG